MNKGQLRVAALQMIATPRVDDNLDVVARLVRNAALAGAQLIILPEFFIQITTADDTKRFMCAEYLGDGKIQAFLSDLSREFSIYLLAGSILTKDNASSKYHNTALLYAPTGNLVSYYHKIHLFRFDDGIIHYDESESFSAGSEICCCDVLGFRIGIAICYDLRFPELFRKMGVVDAIILPAAFTYTTGEAHWELLCRARAIENQCYFLGVNQGGEHESGRKTYGHSMVVDPWGNLVASSGLGEQIVMATLDKDVIVSVRNKLPALEHRIF